MRRSADRAFALAGVTRDDVDVAGLYDCFTVTMLRDLEEMGFCDLGEGAAYYVKEGHTALGGTMPVQHRRRPAVQQPQRRPVGCTTIEVVRQLRGRVRSAAGAGREDRRSGSRQGWAVHGYAGTTILAID